MVTTPVYRRELPLAAAGVLAGLVTALLVLLIWVRAGGVDPGPAAPRATASAPRGRGPFVDALNERVAERLASRAVPRRPLRGAMSLRAGNVVWREPGTGRLFVRAPVVTGSIDAAAANRRDIVLGNLVLLRPRLELVSDGQRWNYELPLAGLLAEDEPSSERKVTFRIAGLRIIDGSASVAMPERDFTLNSVEARMGQVELAGPGLPAPRLRLLTASADLLIAGGERAWTVTAERGDLSFPDGTTTFDLAAATIGGTRLEEVTGSWDPSAPGYGVTATGTVPGVLLADLGLLAPKRLPSEGTARFRFAVQPVPGDGTAIRVSELSLVSGRSQVTGALAVELTPGRMAVERADLTLQDVELSLLEPLTGALPYQGTVSGTLSGPGSGVRLDLTGRLLAEGTGERFGAAITGVVAATRSGLAFRDVRANLNQVPLSALRGLVRGLPLAGQVTGTIRIEGAISEAPLAVDARLELGTGLATLAGTIDLRGSVPRYQLAGRLVGINLQSVLVPAVPDAALTAQYSVAGAGLDPATAEATVRVDGSFRGWRAVPGDTLALSASLGAGTFRVGSAAFRLAGAELVADGTWRFLEPSAGSLRYRLTVADLAPYGPFLPVVGDSLAAGSLRAEGAVTGPLEEPRIAGTLEGEGARVGDWAAGSLRGTYAVTLTDTVPELELQLQGEAIQTGGAGAYESLTARVSLHAPTLEASVRARQAGGGELALEAAGSIPRSGARSVLLQRGWFDLAEGRWELQAPARIGWGAADGVRVTNLLLRNTRTSGEISLDGRVLPLDRLDGRLVVADLPLDELQDLLGRERLVTGRLWADLQLRPPGSPSEIQGAFRLDRSVIEGVALSRLEGTLDYAAGIARTEFSATFDSAGGRLQLRGTLPLRIALDDSVRFRLVDSGQIDAALTAERVSIAPLGLLVPRVRNLAGVFDGNVVVRGTVADPSLSGQLTLSGGQVTVPELNQTYESIAGTVAFNGRTAEIRDLRVRRDGWARVNGTIVFQELNRPVVQLAADLDSFQPIGVAEHPDASFDGRITVVGELSALVVTGRVVIRDGYLAVPQLGVSYYPEYLEAIDPTPVLGRDFGGREGGSWAANARIDGLRATFGEGAWVEAFDATLQLRGDLTIDRAGDQLRLTGTLEGERGTYTLAAGPIIRRFEITRSQVRFLGAPEPNPAIDITARRVVLDPDGRRVEVEVRITGTARAPRLSLASADAPNIPESELLSFLLFGRRTLALGETFATTGEMVFEQTFFGGFAEVAGLELERALSGNLGLQLDLFQVRFGQGFGGLTTPTFVLGRQVANDFFLTVESGLNALLGDAGASASTWAVRLEWAIDPRQALELGSEPLNRARLLRGIGAALPPGRPSPQQLYVEYRRRWLY